MSTRKLPHSIKALRKEKGWSQDQLSKKASIPFSTLVKIESGYTPNPSIETIIKIADAFGVALDKLMGRNL